WETLYRTASPSGWTPRTPTPARSTPTPTPSAVDIVHPLIGTPPAIGAGNCPRTTCNSAAGLCPIPPAAGALSTDGCLPTASCHRPALQGVRPAAWAP